MKHPLPLLLLALLLAAAGCMPPPPMVDELAALDSGGTAPDSAAVNAQVRGYYEMRLFDPLSALYKYTDPAPLWYRTSENTFLAGWGVVVTMNAKNRLGGYVGWSESLAIFRDGRLTWMYDGPMAQYRKERYWDWR